MADFIVNNLNLKTPEVPDYTKVGRLVLLSKDTKEFAHIGNTRPIAVQTILMRVIEKILLKVIKETDLMNTGEY
jgi:hypothetical protein